jgi:hypothetical protein
LPAVPRTSSAAGWAQTMTGWQELRGCLPQPVLLRGAAVDWPMVQEPLGLSWLSQQQNVRGKVRVAPSLQFPFVEPQLVELLSQLKGELCGRFRGGGGRGGDVHSWSIQLQVMGR